MSPAAGTVPAALDCLCSVLKPVQLVRLASTDLVPVRSHLFSLVQLLCALQCASRRGASQPLLGRRQQQASVYAVS